MRWILSFRWFKRQISLYISIGFKNKINIGFQYRIITNNLREIPSGDSHTEEQVSLCQQHLMLFSNNTPVPQYFLVNSD